MFSEKICAELHKDVAQITPPDGLREKLHLAAREKRPLIVKLGFDPTAPDLHLGHAVVLRKMRQFQDAGHKLVIVIGAFTARIGDPTGRNKTRPPLSPETIQENARTYLAQLSRILDMDSTKLTVRFNTEWLADMAFGDVLKLVSRATLAQLLQRDDFAKRHAAGIPIGMHELLYPLMQGHDSVVLNADIEMGGTDQLFNCLVGRSLQESNGVAGQVVVSMPLLVGLDGKDKMSKSHNNTIGLTDAPNDMYGKAMSIPDALLPNYLDLASGFSAQDCERLKAGLADGSCHPMMVKKSIAAALVALYHGAAAAEEAAAFFTNQFQKKDDAEKIYQPVAASVLFGGAGALSLVNLCVLLQPTLSKGQARQLIEAGAVSIDGVKCIDFKTSVPMPTGACRLRIGRRGFFEIQGAQG